MTRETYCPKCHDPVDDGEWHRPCFLAVLGAILYRRFG